MGVQSLHDGYRAAIERPDGPFEALRGLLSRSQETPRASSVNNRFLAMTRLARPNRLNSCAPFLASPL